jgi:hypothetical protein
MSAPDPPVPAASEDEVQDHPTLFIREDMVTIQLCCRRPIAYEHTDASSHAPRSSGLASEFHFTSLPSNRNTSSISSNAKTSLKSCTYQKVESLATHSPRSSRSFVHGTAAPDFLIGLRL